MPDTFCILPWKQLIVRTNGATHVCNRIRGHLSENGVRLNVARHGLDAIWNGTELRSMRSSMVEGERVPACQECYDLEAVGSLSLRQHENAQWRAGFLNERPEDQESVAAATRARKSAQLSAPSFLQLDVGSLCNLRCRMCNSGASSAINNDPVHRAWTGEGMQLGQQRFAWFRQEQAIANVLRAPHELRQLHIIGGEPLLVRDVRTILERLIEVGAAQSIELSLHTNATTTRCEWLTLTEAFKRCTLWISIDGFEDEYEYIRYPARWAVLCQNIASLRKLPKTDVAVHIVFQIYNALNVVELFRYLDAIGLPFYPHILYEPTYLRATLLPQAVRVLAAQRIRAYATDCRLDHRPRVESLATFLEHTDTTVEPNALRDFMLFTNDLDASRGQSFSDTHEELVALFEDAGIFWSCELRHAAANLL
jgi:molybdenum cofactor biosynthesis enzyme MoaA